MNCLVLGGGGFIGSHVVDALVEAGQLAASGSTALTEASPELAAFSDGVMADAARAIAVHQALDQLSRAAATPPPPPPPVFVPAQPVLEDVSSELPTVAE